YPFCHIAVEIVAEVVFASVEVEVEVGMVLMS
ncbi:hypothetical protein Tco_0035610, partial [Tanacetum coccineum]